VEEITGWLRPRVWSYRLKEKNHFDPGNGPALSPTDFAGIFTKANHRPVLGRTHVLDVKASWRIKAPSSEPVFRACSTAAGLAKRNCNR
jgi:hypothetical protein